MKTKNTIRRHWARQASRFLAVLMLVFSVTHQAAAKILFEDDAALNIKSEGIILDSNNNAGTDTIEVQFGSDGTDASITYDPSTEDLTIATPNDSDLVNIDNATLTSTADGGLDFRLSDRFSIRENADPATNSACTSLGELIYDTTDNELQICTATGGVGAATWAPVDTTAGTIDLQTAYDNETATDREILVSADNNPVEVRASAAGDDLLELQANDSSVLLGLNDLGGTTIDINSLVVDWDATGAFALDSTAGVHIGGANPSDFTVASDGAADDLTIAVTGATDSSVVVNSSGTGVDAIDLNATAGGITVDSASGISVDAAGASNFSTSSGDLTLAATTNSMVITGAEAAVDAVTITATNAAGGIDVNAGTGGITLDTTGVFSIDGVGASNVTTDSGALTLSTTTSGNVNVNSAGQIVFDDAQLTGTVQVSDTDADWAAYYAGDGIVDNINDVGAQLGGDSVSTYNFGENNVLTDNDAVYAALNKLDLKWGDLASTANTEGASLVGVEDSGGNYTATDVEGVLTEIAGQIGSNAANIEDLIFYPEYPDTTVYADGTNNRGTLESFYDATEEMSYYNWISGNATTQDIDLRFQFTLPNDFASTGNFTYRYRTGTVTEADNDVEVRLYNVTDTQECANDLTNGTAGVWATGTITSGSIDTGCTGLTALDAGDLVEVQIKLYDNSGAGDYADVGWVNWAYTN